MAFTGGTAGIAAGAQTNDTVLDWALEATYKNPPTGSYQQGRFTAETLSQTQTTARPSEINTLKEASQSVVTQVAASGRISGALSTGTFDDFIAGVLGADWQKAVIPSQKNTSFIQIRLDNWSPDGVTHYPAVIGFLTPSGTPIKDSLAALPSSGMISVYEATTKRTLFIPYVEKVGYDSVLVVDPASLSAYADMMSNNVLVCGDGSSLTFNGVVNGNTDKTYTIRKKILSCWLMYPGSLINQVQLTFTQGQFAQVEVDVISANETLSETDIASAELAAPTGVVHNTVDNFLGVTLLGNPIAGCVTSASITLARSGSSAAYGNGHADACGVITGQLLASGSISFYFRSWDEYQAALSAQQGPVVLKTVDSAGNGYAFVFLNAALRNPQVQTDAVNKTYELKLDIEGNPSTDGGTFSIFRLTPPAA